ncbi:Protein of unknown function DUF639 [Dillenia turbinata]|uniref:Uncharacterized protein n=1 Tax=Dillenia turbinata TaxID=194707 RepID=A0AAN8ZSV0_9MAGN
MEKPRKHLSSIANAFLQKCAQSLNTLVKEFESGWSPESGNYSKRLVEFCSRKALSDLCCNIEEKIADGSFSRFTFDMMLAWETPNSQVEESHEESVAKEKEDRKPPKSMTQGQDDVSLFYSDIMPLLVDHGPSIGEDAFVWLGSMVPLSTDVVNGKFIFGALTAPTAYRLHFPAYDKFIREMDSCTKQLQKQAKAKGVELADDEFILHVEGTASTQRVVRQIGGSSWPGRLTLTNYALYFEASGVISYEDALKIDLSKDVEQNVKPTASGPWGAPLFDKAISYESSDLSESIIFEFPEVTSSTRRDLWRALIKEVILLHQFLSGHKVESLILAWEMHARTILGVIRLHAASELLRLSSPAPASFLIFSLYDELPKGDCVLEELAESLKHTNTTHQCSASSILRSLNMPNPSVPSEEVRVGDEATGDMITQTENLSSLESSINITREEAKELGVAKATAKGLKEEGIADSIAVLLDLLSPLKQVASWFEEIIQWHRPALTLFVILNIFIITYKEWFAKAMAACLLWVAAIMLKARQERVDEKCQEIVVRTGSDQTTVESIVNAQHGLRTAQEILCQANIGLLKIRAIFLWKGEKQTKHVVMVLVGLATLLAIVPLKFIIIGAVFHKFILTSTLGKYIDTDRGNRRLKEWWDSIPVVPVRTVDKAPDDQTGCKPVPK